jgi:hypothetical protein
MAEVLGPENDTNVGVVQSWRAEVIRAIGTRQPCALHRWALR